MEPTATKEQIRQITSGLNSQSQDIAYEAAKSVSNYSAVGLERPLVSTLRRGRRPFNRAAAAYAMQMVTTPNTIRALEHALESKAEHPSVRGQAAESLAHCHRKESHHILLRCLGDTSKDVRFWCAYALGEMAEKRAVAALKLLSADRRIVRGFHSVAKEADDAIKLIEAENVGHGRRSGCVFCV